MRRVALLAALLVVAAGCGHDSATVPPGAIAVVGGQPVPRTALDAQLAQTRRAYAARGQAFPKPGTDAYRRLQEYLNATHTWGARHAGVLGSPKALRNASSSG